MAHPDGMKLAVRLLELGREQDKAARREEEVRAEIKEALADSDLARLETAAHEMILLLMRMADRWEEISELSEELDSPDIAFKARMRAAGNRTLVRDGLCLSISGLSGQDPGAPEEPH